jgi:hypothetical protein
MRTRASQWLVATPSTLVLCPTCWGALSTPATRLFPSALDRDTMALAVSPRVCLRHAQAGRFSSTFLPGGPVRPVAGLCSVGPAG